MTYMDGVIEGQELNKKALIKQIRVSQYAILIYRLFNIISLGTANCRSQKQREVPEARGLG